jgi:hypothetical protein
MYMDIMRKHVDQQEAEGYDSDSISIKYGLSLCILLTVIGSCT